MSAFSKAIRALLPIHFADEALKVGPVVQAEIDKLRKDAEAKVAALQAQHSVQAKTDDIDARVLAAQKVFADYDRLIGIERAGLKAVAGAVLPPLDLTAK